MVELIPVNVEQQVRKILLRVLEQAGFKDGAMLSNEEISNTDVPIFWEDILDVDIAQTKPYYLVFSIGNQTRYYVDNKVSMVIQNISLDLFTTQDMASKETFNIRYALETAIAYSNFETLQPVSKFYDSDLKLNQISYITSIRINSNGNFN